MAWTTTRSGLGDAGVKGAALIPEPRMGQTSPGRFAKSEGRIGDAPRGGEGHVEPLLSLRGYFHSHNLECVFPWAPTSNSKIAATVLRRANFGEAEL